MGFVIAAAAVAGLAAAWRAAGGPATTYLLDSAGWLLAVAGAAAEARVGALLFDFDPRGMRRRAAAGAVVGIVVCLAGCLILSLSSSGGTLVQGMAGAALVGGFGLGLGGILTLAWRYGGGYAADRIDRLADDDW